MSSSDDSRIRRSKSKCPAYLQGCGARQVLVCLDNNPWGYAALNAIELQEMINQS